MAKPNNRATPGIVPQAPRRVKMMVCGLYRDALKKYANNVSVLEIIRDFIDNKRKDPLAPYGSKDRPLTGGGALTGIQHAHLTHNISMLYSKGGANPIVFHLYGPYTHDDMGTGQPTDLKAQSRLFSRIKNQEFVPYEKLDEKATLHLTDLYC